MRERTLIVRSDGGDRRERGHVLMARVNGETVYLARCSLLWQTSRRDAVRDCRAQGCGRLGRRSAAGADVRPVGA